MAPIFDKAPICGSTPPQTPCFYYYKFSTFDGSDPNWNSYKITSDILGTTLCSNIINPADPIGGGVYNYAQAIGINGLSDWYFNSFGGAAIGGIISYYGIASQQNNYNFIITNSVDQPVVTGWTQGFSCTPKCFEHPFKKPDFDVTTILMDSASDIKLNFLATGNSPWPLNLSNPADISLLEKILQNIYGPQVVVFTQAPPSGNIILRIENIYTDQITIFLSAGTMHIMSEVPCS
jgi:hypothetical protein